MAWKNTSLNAMAHRVVYASFFKKSLSDRHIFLTISKETFCLLNIHILLTLERDEESEDVFLSGLKGTPAWMAPEVISGKSVSTSTDIYGLGLIFWEMMSAEKPFEGKTMEEVSFESNTEQFVV